MKHLFARLHTIFFGWRHLISEEFIALALTVLVFTVPSAGALRFFDRSLFMTNANPGATSSYKVSFQYMSPDAVGSINLLFCNSPIPYDPCVAPAGLDVSHAILTDQQVNAGYSILSQTSNHIVLTRPATPAVGGVTSSYTFDNIINPSDTSQAFAIRLESHAASDASDAIIDFGSVRGQVTDSIVIETQVPPLLMFCVAGQVNDDCSKTNENYYSDMGQLGSRSTLTAESQMSVGTNASGGFAITANGQPMSAGTSVINAPTQPTPSLQGNNQFGINLVANSEPSIGSDPEGTWANAVASPNYSIPNQYMYVPGDTVAYSANVSLMKKFTVSYIVNASDNLRAGVYTTTINYIASGRF